MLIKPPADIPSSEITDPKLYFSRRQFIRTAGGTAAVVAAGVLGAPAPSEAAEPAPHGRKLENVHNNAFSTSERPNTWEAITTYNNYYEFGIDKDSPSIYAKNLKTEPWTVTVDGECNKKAAYHVEDIVRSEQLEERIYRHRCVEAWSMVIPWVGFPLGDFIKRCEPTSKARFVEFTTLYDPRQDRKSVV
jgi:methionine sulfoxide reductase catalytic subunit